MSPLDDDGRRTLLRESAIAAFASGDVGAFCTARDASFTARSASSAGIGNSPPSYLNLPSALSNWKHGASATFARGPQRSATLAACPGTNS